MENNFKIQFRNKEDNIVQRIVSNKDDLIKLCKTEAIMSILSCQIRSGMSKSMHDYIAKHNSDVSKNAHYLNSL